MENNSIKLSVMEIATIFEALQQNPLSNPSAPILIERKEDGNINLYDSEKEIGVITNN